MRRTPGGHVPNIKNRSSKHLACMTKCKPAVRSMSNAALDQMNTKAASMEKKRRAEKKAKRDAKAAK